MTCKTLVSFLFVVFMFVHPVCLGRCFIVLSVALSRFWWESLVRRCDRCADFFPSHLESFFFGFQKFFLMHFVVSSLCFTLVAPK